MFIGSQEVGVRGGTHTTERVKAAGLPSIAEAIQSGPREMAISLRLLTSSRRTPSSTFLTPADDDHIVQCPPAHDERNKQYHQFVRH